MRDAKNLGDTENTLHIHWSLWLSHACFTSTVAWNFHYILLRNTQSFWSFQMSGWNTTMDTCIYIYMIHKAKLKTCCWKEALSHHLVISWIWAWVLHPVHQMLICVGTFGGSGQCTIHMFILCVYADYIHSMSVLHSFLNNYKHNICMSMYTLGMNAYN